MDTFSEHLWKDLVFTRVGISVRNVLWMAGSKDRINRQAGCDWQWKVLEQSHVSWCLNAVCVAIFCQIMVFSWHFRAGFGQRSWAEDTGRPLDCTLCVGLEEVQVYKSVPWLLRRVHKSCLSTGIHAYLVSSQRPPHTVSWQKRQKPKPMIAEVYLYTLFLYL